MYGQAYYRESMGCLHEIANFTKNKNVRLIRFIQSYLSAIFRSNGLIFRQKNYLIADMICIITEQCMGIEWARCKELQISRLLDDLHRYKIGGLIRII